MLDSTARKLAIIIVAATGLLVVGFAGLRMFRGGEPHVDIDPARYPVRGLDLSSHNGVPDFDSIAAAGYSFVYLKATEGTDYRDPSFTRNYVAARRAGLAIGAYHFFRFESDGAGQAANFLRTIASCNLQLPVVIDVEEWGNTADASTAMVVERMESMLTMLECLYGPAAIYSNKNGEARFVRGRFGHLPLWICSFTDPPLARRHWHLWQHSHCGRVPGVKGNVDLDVFNGDTAQWHEWLDSVAATINKGSLR